MSDSLRLNLRLTSHLLIPANSTDLFGEIMESNIPVAIDGTETKAETLTSLLSEIDAKGRSIPLLVISPDSVSNLPSHFIIIDSNEINRYHFNKEERSKPLVLPPFSNGELLLLSLPDCLPTADDLVKLWQARGKMPNFIKMENENLLLLSGLVNDLNSFKKIFGVVSSDEGLLSEVLLKDKPGMQVSGFFSFPALGAVIIKPYKAGYQFSPDVIYNAPSNEKNMKIFRGIRLEPDFAMSEHFRFDKGVRNIYRPDFKEFVIQNVSFSNDQEIGPVAFFDNAYVDAGIESKSILNAAFSISVWIKPTELGKNNSILGKGTNFVLKIHDGKLTFTMAGIKDYISENSSIEEGKWTHVAVVFSALENELKFYLNGKMTDQISLIAAYVGTDHSLLIGSNLWEEFFVGYMGDVKIWERELNESEIHAEFQAPFSKKKFWLFEFILTGLILLVAFVFLIFRKRKIGLKQSKTIDEPKMQGVDKTKNGINQIVCFGNLKIIDPNGKELSSKLSPKLKQLFVMILLHSGNDRKGISSKKLSDLLWPGMNAINAKNTRGTSIQNLRLSLADCNGLTVSFKDKLWLIELADDMKCDYYEVDRLIAEIEIDANLEQKKQQVQKLVSILKTGKFIPGMEFSWMDRFRDQFSNRLIELCLTLLNTYENREPVLQLEMAEIISMYDELNENALQTKVRILYMQGKHSLAKSVYESYVKLYAELYKTNYPIDFLELIKS